MYIRGGNRRKHRKNNKKTQKCVDFNSRVCYIYIAA